MTLGTTWRICIKFTSPVQIEGVWPSVHILADVYVTLHDVLERSIAESAVFFESETWLEGSTSAQWKRSAPTEISISLSSHLCHLFFISLHISLSPFLHLSPLSSRCTVCCLLLSVVVLCVCCG